MLIANSNAHEISTYPGGYTPVHHKFEKFTAELSKPHEGASNPAYNICETSEYYKIELAAPGLQREDFSVSITKQGHLSISALHTKHGRIEHENYKEHAFNYECFSRDLLLPENIDTDFTRAEYRTGILSLWFLKTKKPYKKSPSVIIVY